MRMLSILLVFAVVCFACEAWTGEFTAKAVVASTNGVVRTFPVAAEAQPDGGMRFVVKATDARDAKFVAIQADCATAQKGDDGYWVSQRGVLGHFTRESGRWQGFRNWLTLPYFGMKTPHGTFLAIIEGMRFEFDMHISVSNGVYRMFPQWRVFDTGIGAYEDMCMVVYPLADGAGYNEMARAYRKYKNARDPEIKPIKERARERPHLMNLARSITIRNQCAKKSGQIDADFTPETERPVLCTASFDQTLSKLRKLKECGVDDVSVCIVGWQAGGYDGRCPAVFPVAPEAGGEDSLRRLIKGVQQLGYIIDSQDNYTDCYTVSPMWDGGCIACLGRDGKLDRHGVWSGGRAYNLCLRNAWDVQGFMPRDLKRTAGLGFWGCHYIDVFTAAFPYRCLNPAHAANRNGQAQYQIKAAKLCRELFGGFASECCYDHLIGYVDYINYATPEMRSMRQRAVKGEKSLIDKVVPFWELAFHDVVLSNPDKVTQEVLNQPENLILVEFGGRPIFYHISDGNIPGIVKAYEQFKRIRHLQTEEMVRHDEVADGLVRVRYGNGETIYINHTDKLQTADGVAVPAMDFRLVHQNTIKGMLQ